VGRGECLASIAHDYGLAVNTIWDDPGNRELRQKRSTPTILFEGDVVTIPDITPKVVAANTGQSHTIKIRREKAMLRVKIQSNGKPVANEPYDLTLDGEEAPSGSTNGEGLVEAEISPLASEAIISFAKRGETHVIRLGHLDPVEAPLGVQARLHQLGFYRGPVAVVDDGQDRPALTTAIRTFQKANGLDVTGAADDPTRAALVKAYGQ
jgi:hypothetical protein